MQTQIPSDKFTFTLPVDLEKSEDGEWRVRGLASTEAIDLQGEKLMQKGIDLTPIAAKQGIINYNHEKGPENTIGLLDGYQMSDQGLYLEGRLFKKHDKAKAVQQILSSLKGEDRGRMGMSVEGAVLKRNAHNPKIIEKCIINAVALTMAPVNSNTFVDLIKSFGSTDAVEFDASEENLAKALGVGDGGLAAPNSRTGGDALATSNMQSRADDEATSEETLKPKRKRKEQPIQKAIKRLSKDQIQKSLITILDQMQVLHPDCSRNILWEVLQDRMQASYPELS